MMLALVKAISLTFSLEIEIAVFANFAAGGSWSTKNGIGYSVFEKNCVSRVLKKSIMREKFLVEILELWVPVLCLWEQRFWINASA